MRVALVPLALIMGCAQAFTIHFANNCPFTVWAAVGAAPNGQPNPSIAFGSRLDRGNSANYAKSQGVRAWGRTGCDANGANCQTGNCNGGLVCNDGGITAGVILSEFGNGFNGQRTAWDLSHVDASINIDTRLASSDGQSVTCTQASCPPDQAYNTPTDYQADRNSPLGATYTHTFCP
ncbi:Osmotin thaumatin-like protein [Vararia minispora EC-137]|uniref:Osmotin thaumatin-like protein n=1 Tax=Vararia minispora EC-137 TaxID=1314806 RepID=A0ACB8QK41_9AGAM|nr:Osmotin thaumatin-like protein [Vararia minispora EC-137]